MHVNRVKQAGRRWSVSRNKVRILAIGLIAFPEPSTTVLGFILFGASFFLPKGNDNFGRACSCGCDFHQCAVHHPIAQGTGALVNARRMIAPTLPCRNSCPAKTHGLAAASSHQIERAGAMNCRLTVESEAAAEWRKVSGLRGTLFHRLSGYGTKLAVRCEPARAVASRAA